jgi:hypothetical protein
VSAFPLIEDALKVPCFTTKQKSQLLKWYEEILSKQEGSEPNKKPEETNNDEEEENYDDFDWDAFEKSQSINNLLFKYDIIWMKKKKRVIHEGFY